MSPLFCSKCGQQIKPGDKCYVDSGQLGKRILLDSHATVRHEVCPPKKEANEPR